MATRRAPIVNENLVNQGDVQSALLKKAAPVTTATRRAALGNLANRTDKLREVKPVEKVDRSAVLKRQDSALTQRKAIVTATTTANKVDAAQTKPVTVTRTKLTKSDSDGVAAAKPAVIQSRYRLPSATSQSNSNLIKQGDVQSALSKKTATVTTATRRPVLGTLANRTDKLREVKPVEKVDRSAVLKRQDSTLTRRKAVITTTATIHKVDAAKRTVTRTKSAESDSDGVAAPKPAAPVPAIQSRFRPPSFASYSNGLIDGFGGMNIDDGDEDNTLLVCEYVNDIYSYLFEMEQKYAIRKGHLDGQSEVHPRMRTVLLDWISEVHTQYHFAQETFHIAVSTIDRYLQVVKSTSRKNLQLVGVSALLIASKYEELYPPEVHDFIYITDNTYTKEQILSMEKHILKKLRFELGAPTPIHFLRRFSKAAQADGQTHVLSKYFIELAAIDYTLSEYLPSEIAAAALYISLSFMHSLLKPEKSIQYDSLWTEVMQFYSTYSAMHLQPIVKELIEYILIAPTLKTNNVYTKYTSPKQGEMSLVCERSKHILNQIHDQI